MKIFSLYLQGEKDFRSKQLIREAIMENDFLKNLPSQQVREIVDYMEKKKVVAGAYVIKEGDTGTDEKSFFIIIAVQLLLTLKYVCNFCRNIP